MSYRVVKTIKGIPYLYEQQSYRDGRKVRTVCRCLGRASATQADALGTRQRVRHEAGDALATTARPRPPTPAGDPPPLAISAKLERLAISETAIRREYAGHMTRLAGLGFDVSKFPAVSVKHGRAVACRRGFFGRYRVTLPRYAKGNRTAFKSAFSEALARGSLDLLRTQRPEKFAALAAHLDNSYRETTAALTRYILTTDHENKYVALLTLHFFGKVLALRNWRHTAKQPPERLGVIAYGQRRRDWTDEAAPLLGDIIRRGYADAASGWTAELRHAQAAERKALKEWQDAPRISMARLWSRRKVKRAMARHAVLAETVNKVMALGRVFGSAG